MNLEVLEEAISDVGYWSWWDAELPTIFQVEFGGTQLWSPSPAFDQPPSGQVALRFVRPSFVGFLTRSSGPGNTPIGWSQQLHRDEIEPFEVSYGDFTLSSREVFANLLDQAESVDVYCGNNIEASRVKEGDSLLAFWAGPVGLAVVANEMRVINHEGELSLEAVEQMHAKWWKYWKEYWARKDSDHPLPKDYACEVTIPVREA